MKHLHYEKYLHAESSQWIVFLHGAGGSIQTWKSQIDALKTSYNLLLIDLRDHGHSKNIEPAYPKYDFDIISRDVLTVLDLEKITTAHFITLSFGSVLMQSLYHRRPGIVDKMVFVGGIFNANWMIKGFVHLARFFNLFLSFSMMYKVFSYLLMPKKNHQVARRVYQMQARKLSSEEYLKWLGLYSEFFRLLKTFNNQSLSNQMLVLMGSEDYLFLPSAEKFVRNHAQATLAKVNGAGHICNIEKPKETNHIVTDFLNSQ